MERKKTQASSQPIIDDAQLITRKRSHTEPPASPSQNSKNEETNKKVKLDSSATPLSPSPSSNHASPAKVETATETLQRQPSMEKVRALAEMFPSMHEQALVDALMVSEVCMNVCVCLCASLLI